MRNSILILIMLCLICCKKENTEQQSLLLDSSKNSIDSANVVLDTVRIESQSQKFKNLNDEILDVLKDKNYKEFATYIHPEKGVNFSMYAHLNPQKDKHFTREEFTRYLEKNTQFTWGEKDGSGNALVLPIKNYFREWLFKRDFTAAEFSFNQFEGKGNTLNNIQKIYPDAEVTENYIPGTEIYSGMDWNSLIFVFEEYNGLYYLVAVANNSWTV